jgi:hypothetical protein
MEHLMIYFNENYEPALQQLEELAIYLGISKSGIVRDLVCDFFGYVPEKEMPVYKKQNLKDI